ncbi:glutamic acid-rich protein-like isoform X12 [Schistocerca cancellata]|uniref:glutamic acid-rich protein-like isoform X12 n=1 Tax=Schistocerca cancellata TaxID=274614 RepID=UPI0021198E3A|nr:glutamic acid-rich protein-like isoform X12 [Schistocerca cancellata]
MQKMASGKCRSSVCGATLIKQEPVEADPRASPEQEIEHISVKQETPVDAKPLASSKQEMEYVSAEEETPEWDVPDDHNSTHDPKSIIKEESSSSEDFLSPSAPSIEDDDEEDEDAVSEDDFQELKHEVESRSSGSEPERRTYWDHPTAMPSAVEDVDKRGWDQHTALPIVMMVFLTEAATIRSSISLTGITRLRTPQKWQQCIQVPTTPDNT